MDIKSKEYNEILNHNINIIERKSISLTGIKKLNNFNDKEFFVESVMGHIIIKGDNLELIKMDTFQGNLSIKGLITSVNYIDNNKMKTDKIISRLFKW